MTSRARSLALVVGLLWTLPACDPSGVCRAGVCETCDCPAGCAAPGFKSHTRERFADDADLSAWCAPPDAEAGTTFCKLVVSGLATAQVAAGRVHVYDRNFFHFHDEWYWYTSLNGAPLPGCPRRPLANMSFATIADIYREAVKMPASSLPMGLRWAGERLYADAFYDRSMRFPKAHATDPDPPRHWYAGTLRLFPANPARKVPGRLWAIDGEFGDHPNAEDLRRLLAVLQARLPADVQVYWLARANDWQQALAAQLRAGDSELKERVLVIDDLLVPGEVDVIQPGVTAGVLRRIRAADVHQVVPGPDDIVVLDGVPDDLPPVAGILTAVPQSAQAHVALLARARGTPDAYVEGVWDNPVIKAWAKDKVPVAMQLVQGQAPRYVALSPQDWAAYKKLRGGGPHRATPHTQVAGLPVAVTLGATSQVDRQRLVAMIGGKAAGFGTLLGRQHHDTPPGALALTVRGFAHHIAPLAPVLGQLFSDVQMHSDTLEARWWRFAVLEGADAFHARQDPLARAWLDATLADPHTPTLVRQAVSTGGVRGWVRNQPMDPAWLQSALATLNTRFGHLDPAQGLRFRSSATVEDLAGFTAAGVYSSHTGYLRPWLHPDPTERHKSVERAIRRVWSAWFRYEAVEERRLGGFDPLRGRMAVLVHPGFADALEAANGVALVHVQPNPAGGHRVETVIEAQQGALSVTNPTSAHVPERTRLVEIVGGAEPSSAAIWQRERVSSEAAVVLSEAESRALHARVRPLALTWLVQHNATLPAPWRRRTLQLDLEWRKVAPGWPMGTSSPARLVLKQVRPFGPRRRLSPEVLGVAGAPEDLFDAAIAASVVTCTCGVHKLTTWQVRTDPGWPAWPFDDKPFVAHATWASNFVGLRSATHLDIDRSDASGSGRTPTIYLELSAPAATKWGLHTVDIRADGTCAVDGALRSTHAHCTAVTLDSGPEAWLLDRLAGG